MPATPKVSVITPAYKAARYIGQAIESVQAQTLTDWEILDGGRYGALVPVDDAEAMAQAIVRALSGQVALASAAWLEQFRVEAVAEQYLRVMLAQTP